MATDLATDIDVVVLCLYLMEYISHFRYAHSHHLHQNKFPGHSLCYIEDIVFYMLLSLLLFLTSTSQPLSQYRRYINIVTAKLIRSIIYNLNNKTAPHCDSSL